MMLVFIEIWRWCGGGRAQAAAVYIREKRSVYTSGS